MIKPSEKQRFELLKIQHELKKVAISIGSMHSFWDFIFDIDAMLKGKESIINDPNELILAAKKTLNKWLRANRYKT